MNEPLEFALIFFFHLLGLTAVIGTIFPYLKSQYWLIRGCDFPRLQFMGFQLIAFVGYFWLWEDLSQVSAGFALIVGITFLVQLWHMAPFFPLSPVQVKPVRSRHEDENISLMVANVYQDNTLYSKLLNLISKHQPDVVLTLETNSEWEQKLEHLSMEYHHSVKVPQENKYGMHLFSKLPVSDISVRYLLKEDIPSISCTIQTENGKKVRFFGLHPEPPSPSESEDAVMRNAEILLIGKEISHFHSKQPVIVAGDLNDVAWSRTTKLFRKISGLLDPRIGRGFFNTYHANIPLLRWPLDHVFHSDNFGLVTMKRLGHIGSDHFPIYIKLACKPDLKDVHVKEKLKNQESKEIKRHILRGLFRRRKQQKESGVIS